MTQPAPSLTAAPATTRPRLFYLDNLRVALTVLVVVHHAAATYSGIPGAWYYSEPAAEPSASIFGGLLMIDQAFFMGAFFLIAGFFVQGSFERKGGRRFLSDRLVRLGIPLLVFLVVLRPLVNFGYYGPVREGAGQQGLDLPYWLFYVLSWDPGPMWFVELLLVFSLVYVLARHLRRGRDSALSEVAARPVGGRWPGVAAVIGFAVGLTLVTYVWRIVVPIGTGVPILGLPTVAYLPQYAALFTIGLLAARRGWLENVPRTAGRAGFAAAVMAAAVLVFVFNSTGDAFVGHGSWQSLVMATCESVVAIGVILGLLVLFRQRFDLPGHRRRFLSEHAYTVYFTHALVLVALGYALSGVPVPAMAKFVVLAGVGVPLCWGVAYLVRALPGAKKAL